MCTSGDWICLDGGFRCSTGVPACINSTLLCDGHLHCYDRSDENSCGRFCHGWCPRLSKIHTSISVHLCVCSGSCGGTFSNANGLLSSPSFPNNYRSNEDCIYTISQPTGTVILLKFLRMHIESHSSCIWDYLEIRDGPSASSPLLAKLCGSEIPASMKSRQNKLWMR